MSESATLSARIRRTSRGLLGAVLIVGGLEAAPALAQSTTTPERERAAARRATEGKRPVKDGAPSVDRATRDPERNPQRATGNNAGVTGRSRGRDGASADPVAVGGVTPSIRKDARPGGREPASGSGMQQNPAPSVTARTNRSQIESKKRPPDPASSSSSAAKPRAN